MKKVADIDKVDSGVQAELTDAAPLTRVDKILLASLQSHKRVGWELVLIIAVIIMKRSTILELQISLRKSSKNEPNSRGFLRILRPPRTIAITAVLNMWRRRWKGGS